MHSKVRVTFIHCNSFKNLSQLKYIQTELQIGIQSVDSETESK